MGSLIATGREIRQCVQVGKPCFKVNILTLSGRIACPTTTPRSAIRENITHGYWNATLYYPRRRILHLIVLNMARYLQMIDNHQCTGQL